MGWKDDPLTNQSQPQAQPQAGAPAWKSDPLTNQQTSTAATPTDGSSYDPNWKPSGNAAWDFITRPRAKTEGIGAAAQDYGLGAFNYLTGGFGPKLLGPGMQQATQQAQSNLGIMNAPLAAASYVAGPGKILGPTAQALGGGAKLEGALAGGLSGYGGSQSWDPRDDPLAIAKGAALGLGGAAVGSTVGKYVAASARKIGDWLGYGSTPDAIASTTQGIKTDAYNDLKKLPISDADTMLANAKADVSAAGGQQSRTMNEINKLGRGEKLMGQDATDYLTSQKGTMSPVDYTNAWRNLQKTGSITTPPKISAADLNDTLQTINSTSTGFRGPLAGAENDYAPILEQHLNDALDRSGATEAVGKADAANADYKNAQFLQNIQRDIKKYGGVNPSTVGDYNKQWYDKPGTSGGPEDQALMNVYNALSGSGSVPRWQTHLAHEGLDATLSGHILGESLGIPGAGAVGGFATYALAKPALHALRAFSQGTNVQNAIDQAYQPLTGMSRTPVDTQSIKRAIQQLMIGGSTR